MRWSSSSAHLHRILDPPFHPPVGGRWHSGASCLRRARHRKPRLSPLTLHRAQGPLSEAPVRPNSNKPWPKLLSVSCAYWPPEKAPGEARFLRSNATGSQPKATAAVATERASSVTGLVRGSPSDCTRGRRGGGARAGSRARLAGAARRRRQPASERAPGVRRRAPLHLRRGREGSGELVLGLDG